MLMTHAVLVSHRVTIFLFIKVSFFTTDMVTSARHALVISTWFSHFDRET